MCGSKRVIMLALSLVTLITYVSSSIYEDYSITYLDQDRNYTIPCSEDDWDLSPCVTQNSTDVPFPANIKLLCRRLSTVEELTNVFRKKNTQKCLPFFELSYSTIKSLPADVFGNIKFVGIKIKMNDLETIHPAVFEGMKDYLRSIELIGNRIKTIDFIPEAKNLQQLAIFNGQFERISDYGLANLPSLRIIFIIDCPMRVIGKYAFSNSTCEIWIRNCSIGIIDDYAFANSSGKIEIERNKAGQTIQKVGDYVFYNANNPLISFRNVPFNENSLSTKTFEGARIGFLKFIMCNFTTIREDVFSSLLQDDQKPKILVRDLLKCDESLDWIRKNETIRKMFIYRCKRLNKNAITKTARR